jgi:hypothetical protein
MLLQTNSYVVPRDRKGEHARLVRRFRQTFGRLGCDSFEVYEQVGSNWSAGESSGRYVQIMRFRDRRHQLAVQEAERNDPDAQGLIAEFCDLINFPYQRQQGLFAVGFYIGVLPGVPRRQQELTDKTAASEEIEEESAQDAAAAAANTSPAPVKPPALVEPGAATRAPIVTPIGPGQVPIITPVPLDQPAPAAADPADAHDVAELAPHADLDAGGEADAAVEPRVIHTHEGGAPAVDIPTAPAAESPSGDAGPARWQTSDEISDEIDPNADVSVDLSDTDEAGRVRVADEALLKAEADFAEYVADPAGAFDELKSKPPVVEGTLLDDVYNEDADSVQMNDDDALEALQAPDAAGGPAPLPPLNGQSASANHEEESENFSSEEPQGETDELAPLIDESDEEQKTSPPEHDSVRH